MMASCYCHSVNRNVLDMMWEDVGMTGFKQSVKVFSAKFSLPMDPRKFSPLKVYRYMVCGCKVAVRGVVCRKLSQQLHADTLNGR